MSSFVAIVHPPGAVARTEEVARLLEPVAYLGPHGMSLWAEDNLSIGALLFSVAPEAPRERQPLSGGDGRYVLAADARLDDRAGLLRQLGPAALVNDQSTDTELLLAAYLTWGEDCVRHILGDYGFAVYDRREHRLFAAADPLGVRRLFFMQLPSGVFVIGSQDAFLLALPDVALHWNHFAVGCWLLARPHRELSLFQEVQVLACGQCLVRTPERLQVTRWWEPDPLRETCYAHEGDYIEHYLEVMRSAVGDRLRSATGVVASELSGGIDSGTVTALASRLAPGLGTRLVAISFRFPGHDGCDEGERILASGAALAIEHEIFDAAEILANSHPSGFGPLPGVSQATENPLADRVFSIAASRRADVLLTGMGGDEMTFGAPEWVYAERLLRGDFGAIRELVQYARRYGRRSVWRELERGLLRPLARKALATALPAIRRRHTSTWMPPWMQADDALRARLAEYRFGPEEPRFRQSSRQSLWNGLRRTQNLLPHDDDRMKATRAGIDVRYPFFDLRLATFALSVPSGLWHRHGMTKWLARTAIGDLLPPAVCWALDDTDCSSVFGPVWGRRAGVMAGLLKGLPTGSVPLLQKADILLPQACDEALSPSRFHIEASYALSLALFWMHRQPRIC